MPPVSTGSYFHVKLFVVKSFLGKLDNGRPLGNRVRSRPGLARPALACPLGLGAVSSVTSEQGQSIPDNSAPREPGPGPRAASWAGWLVMALYLLASFALTWRLWADPAGRMAAGNPGDIALFSWFIRYTATAL